MPLNRTRNKTLLATLFKGKLKCYKFNKIDLI